LSADISKSVDAYFEEVQNGAIGNSYLAILNKLTGEQFTAGDFEKLNLDYEKALEAFASFGKNADLAIVTYKQKVGRNLTIKDLIKSLKYLPRSDRKTVKLIYEVLVILYEFFLSVLKEGEFKESVKAEINEFLTEISVTLPYVLGKRGNLIMLWLGLSLLGVVTVAVALCLLIRK